MAVVGPLHLTFAVALRCEACGAREAHRIPVRIDDPTARPLVAVMDCDPFAVWGASHHDPHAVILP